MHRFAIGLWFTLLALLATVADARADAEIDRLIEVGAFAEAETLLRRQVADPSAPVVDGPAQRLEILQRTRRDFSLGAASLKRALRRALPDVSDEDLVRWTASGALQHRVIDGEVRYFRKAPRNVFLLSDEARERRDARRTSTRRGFDLDDTLARSVALCEETDEPLLAASKHTARYRLLVKPGHPRVRTGAVVRAWLPFPQELPQQTDVRLISSTPAAKRIAPSGTPHRTVYFEQTLGDDGAAPTFEIELEFTSFSQYAKLDPERVEPYDTGGELYTRYTAERLPHIAFTPEARQLAAEIIGDETNPLEKARRVFHWVSANIPWVGEMEYGCPDGGTCTTGLRSSWSRGAGPPATRRTACVTATTRVSPTSSSATWTRTAGSSTSTTPASSTRRRQASAASPTTSNEVRSRSTATICTSTTGRTAPSSPASG